MLTAQMSTVASKVGAAMAGVVRVPSWCRSSVSLTSITAGEQLVAEDLPGRKVSDNLACPHHAGREATHSERVERQHCSGCVVEEYIRGDH